MYYVDFEHTCRYLDDLHIPYRILKDSTDDGISGMRTCAALGRSPAEVYKTILVLSNKKGYPSVMVLAANRKLDLDRAGEALGTACHAAGRGTVCGLCNEEPGLFGPFFPKQLRVFLDESARELDQIVVNAGGAGNYLELAVSDLLTATRAQFAQLSTGDSVELYGRNRVLPLPLELCGCRLLRVRSVGPLEILYEAQELQTGQSVDVCEFFPRFRGRYAVRTPDGVGVGYLEYTNDIKPRFSPAKSGEAKERYRGSFGRQSQPLSGSPRILRTTEENNTFYTVAEHTPGQSLDDLAAKGETLSWETVQTALQPLLEQLQARNSPLGNLRPDTVYLDPQTNKAALLAYAAPTNLFGSSDGLRFQYHSHYDPFSIKGSSGDLTAFYRVVCYALVGKAWNCGPRAGQVRRLLAEKLPQETAKRLADQAGLA